MKNLLAAVSRNKIAATITNNSIAQVFQSQDGFQFTRPGTIGTDLGTYIPILFA